MNGDKSHNIIVKVTINNYYSSPPPPEKEPASNVVSIVKKKYPVDAPLHHVPQRGVALSDDKRALHGEVCDPEDAKFLVICT